MAQVNKQNVIINDLIRQIRSGELKPGASLPMNKDLQKIYNAGRATVWGAKDRLWQLGILEHGSGRGGPGVAGRHTTVSDLALSMLPYGPPLKEEVSWPKERVSW